MIKSKTVFIVGAGASKEVGLPVGDELTTAIAKLVTTTTDRLTPHIKDDTIRNALLAGVPPEQQATQLQVFAHSGNFIRKGMPLAPSIDNFLDAHRDNANVKILGKLAIAKSIIEAERRSRLWVEDNNIYNIPAFQQILDTWYVQFWKLFVTDVHKSNANTIFSNVAFIVFNYDRCIEHFLFFALKIYYELDDCQAAQIMSTLVINHPYGVIGELPYLSGGTGLRFGQEVRSSQLKRSAAQIKTFTERLDEETELKHIRTCFADAKKIVFLGFAFHEINMRLLKPSTITNAEHVFGTVKGFSKPDQDVISGRIRDVLVEDTPGWGSAEQIDRRALVSDSLTLNLHSGTCFELFKEFSQSIGT